MKPPCEIVVWYVIPAIRSELAKELLNLGMKQKDVSELMDITQPAVSQYITDKRGSGIKLDENVRQMVKNFAKELADGKATKGQLISRTCAICKHVETVDVLRQLNIDKSELGEDCESCLGSESSKC
ncbi:MAG: transcriptional regulator [Methanobrevibacter sp.]|uniref:transcriptional regulator n=1 Tax=Methanobrevibacter sp. TaxID=66852 RepID=UPI0025F2899A|nr:transcriptional regulator [Methanobrevibacter sp.]MBQ8016605.1 transcriptional regulator [Methanobrevibacter sp.]